MSKRTITLKDTTTWSKDMKQNWMLYLLFVPSIIYFIIFHYIPMFGIVIAFKDFKISKGIFGSDWVGLQHFRDLFTGESFPLVLRNTVVMAGLNLTIGFIVPIILAFLLSEVHIKLYKRLTQTISYMPYFIATVVVCQLVGEFVGVNGGVTAFLSFFGLEKQNLLANASPPVFWLINCFTEIWQNAGFSTIIFVAAIASINGDLHEAAAIDGANRWQRISRITFPNIVPLIVMMFTLKIGLVFTHGFDKILLLYMPSTYDAADVFHHTLIVWRSVHRLTMDFQLPLVCSYL